MAGERILVVDDEPGVRSMLAAILSDDGYEVEAAGSGEDGFAAATARPADAVLLDVWLPGIDGLETLAKLRDAGVDAEVVMISGHGTIETAVKATKLGAFDFVEKPLALERTLVVVRNALRQRRLEKKNRVLLDQLTRHTEILGTSVEAERVRREADRAATSDAPVLVTGEQGTGREAVARRIHAQGPRADEAIVGVACSVLPEGQAEAVLFGGASDPGRLAIARRGSVLLEDVDALPRDAQSRLAAWMAEGPDVRVIATCGRDLSALAPPLRERLDVLRIDLAPLRERREDVEALVLRFARDLAREYGRPDRGVAPDAMAALVRYDWPGNARELRNVLERLMLTAEGDLVHLADLPAEIGGAAPSSADLYGAFPSLADGVRAFEHYYLRKLLLEAHGDHAEAARRARIAPDVFKSKLGAESS